MENETEYMGVLVDLVGVLADLVRMENSRNGNPRYEAVISGRNGCAVWPVTAVDSSIAYVMANYMNKRVRVRVRVGTHRGDLTIAEIEEC